MKKMQRRFMVGVVIIVLALTAAAGWFYYSKNIKDDGANSPAETSASAPDNKENADAAPALRAGIAEIIASLRIQ